MPTRTASPEELLRMPDEGVGFELIAGELQERNKAVWCCLIAGNVLTELANAAGDSGWTVGCGIGFQCFADRTTVRRADATFHVLGRLTLGQVHDPGHCNVVPDMVVEVVGTKDKYYDLAARRSDWLEAGAQLVWIIDPEERTIHAYRPDGTVTLFRRTDTLTAEPVLPEFQVPVAELFRLPTAAG